jgi:hypothetical protein
MRILRRIGELFAYTLQNPVSMLGVLGMGASLILIGMILVLDLLGLHANPYIGVLAFLILPVVFVAGGVLVPVGILLERRRRAKATDVPIYPVIDLNQPIIRSRFLAGALVLVGGLTIFSGISFRAIEFMDSVQFCGLTCHKVMHPEYESYSSSPHARVACVTCHIGPGATWFVRSKLSGVHQVFAVLANTYSKPIPTPVSNLRPARETCEQCHWPSKFHGERVKVFRHYVEDEDNTEMTTVMLLKVGGGDPDLGITGGIHWHMNIANEIHYLPVDEKRQEIPYVRFRSPQGVVKEYRMSGFDEPVAPDDPRLRRMDCMDCHNRPTHIFKLPEREVDEQIALGRLDRSIPFIRKVAVEALRGVDPQLPDPEQQISDAVFQFYRDHDPDLLRERREDLRENIETLKKIFQRNIFPGMEIGWGTYENHIGHTDFPGCMRCHDGSHVDASGETITDDCDSCHNLLAMEETDPEVLQEILPLDIVKPRGIARR